MKSAVEYANNKITNIIYQKKVEKLENIIVNIKKESIPKESIKNKIKELITEGNYRTADNPEGRVHFVKKSIDYKIEVLQELLEDN